VVLALAADRKYTRGKDRRMMWRTLAAGGIDICVVPGADSGLTLIEPNVHTLAEEFRVRLKRARDAALVGLLTMAADQVAGLVAAGTAIVG
jgi:hypothetical protein